MVIEFTGNYQDLSTEMGFQYKFFCQHCNSGYMSAFERNELGVAGELLRGASNFLGGIFSKEVDVAGTLQKVVGGPRHDASLRNAVDEIRPLFKQCRHCGTWCCEQVCWNHDATMCKRCAPIADEIETSARSRHVETELSNDMNLEEQKRMEAKSHQVEAPCSNCGGATLGKKFCPECGKPTASEARICSKCGARGVPGTKFCGECGNHY